MVQRQQWLLPCVLWLFLCWRRTQAIEDKCGACTVVAKELSTRLEAEGKRDPIDLRHRLDADGNRYGKVVEYRLSEQRLTELLDDLCSSVSNGHQLAAEQDKPAGRRIWVAADAAGYILVARAEKERQQKELENYCGRILEEHEDDLATALRTVAQEPAERLLCHRLTRACGAERGEL